MRSPKAPINLLLLSDLGQIHVHVTEKFSSNIQSTDVKPLGGTHFFNFTSIHRNLKDVEYRRLTKNERLGMFLAPVLFEALRYRWKLKGSPLLATSGPNQSIQK